MGRSTTPKYRVEATATEGELSHLVWPEKHCGRPTNASLRAFVARLEASTRPGGCNAHCQPLTIVEARVILQATGECVASYCQDTAAGIKVVVARLEKMLASPQINGVGPS